MDQWELFYSVMDLSMVFFTFQLFMVWKGNRGPLCASVLYGVE